MPEYHIAIFNADGKIHRTFGADYTLQEAEIIAAKETFNLNKIAAIYETELDDIEALFVNGVNFSTFNFG